MNTEEKRHNEDWYDFLDHDTLKELKELYPEGEFDQW